MEDFYLQIAQITPPAFAVTECWPITHDTSNNHRSLCDKVFSVEIGGISEGEGGREARGRTERR